MNDLERRALLGDKQAQKECTRQGILLPCPFCGSEPITFGRFCITYVECPNCAASICVHEELEIDGEKVRFKKERPRYYAFMRWNTRPTPHIGRCKDCADRHSSEFCECRPDDAFCSDFTPKEG